MQHKIFSIDYNNCVLRISTKIRISGDDLIFFIHGLGCAKENFDDVWLHAGLKDFSIITFDLPGFGDSPGHDNFSYELQEHAEVCRYLLANFPNYRVHIVGHSMGGAIGILLTEKIHDRVATFINVEGNMIGRDCDISRRKASVSFTDFVEKELPSLILATAMSDEPGRRIWSTLIRKADKRGMYNSSRSLVKWSDTGVLFEKYKLLGCKKVYVYGEINSFMKIVRLMEGMPAVCISKSGHFPMNDNPRKFYNFISEFIER